MSDLSLEIGGYTGLSPSLVAKVTNLCNCAEDAPQQAIVIIHVCGNLNGRSDQTWPGDPDNSDIHLVNQWEQALRRIERLPRATIGVAGGACSGIALEVLLATDCRLADPKMCIELGRPPGNIWPGMMVYRLAHQVGIARARKIVMFD